MWKCSPWQYFTARIVSFDVIALQYTINWDDQDPSGRIVDYYNLALDRVPDPDEVATGSIVLFPQGTYKGREGVRLGGQRYHQVRLSSAMQLQQKFAMQNQFMFSPHVVRDIYSYR